MTGRESAFGLPRPLLDALRQLFDRTPGLQTVWIYGSRARGDAKDTSDIDLAIDAPSLPDDDFLRLVQVLEALPTLHRIDAVRWQAVERGAFQEQIRRDRQVLWTPHRLPVVLPALGTVTLKRFQSEVLRQFDRYLDLLNRHEARAADRLAQLRTMEDMEDIARQAADFPRAAWEALQKAQALPSRFSTGPHSSRFDGAGRPIPNVCLKVPTGGGKTLLAAACVGRLQSARTNRHTGLVLWVVPNEAIYRQTLKSLSDRDHPYRQMLNVAGAGRVKILEKTSPLSRLDVDSHLCVMLLMLQAAARQSKETLRFFRDRGNVLGFLPREDDLPAHFALLQQVPNLDVYGASSSQAEACAQMGSVIKSSLGNVMRLLRPVVVIDEGHHAYTDNALRTIDGFNPSFMLELSATPREPGAKGPGSNILVDVRGTDLEEAEMIKLPIQVEVKAWNDWQSCLAASVQRLDELQREAERLQARTARYLRPILLVQVERTGAELQDTGFIHAEQAKAFLLQLGMSGRQIAIKTSERNDLQQPENIDLLSPACEVRAIITKQALQEGWDCPFAYVLCALAAGRNPAAMTQLVGRILRQPQATKTGSSALDACYVLCHDAGTADVVRSIKASLEAEGMGDLPVQVVSSVGGEDQVRTIVRQRRRPATAALRLFLPRVTCVRPDGSRRELAYESDVLAAVDWSRIDASRLALQWAPASEDGQARHLALGLDILRPQASTPLGDALTVQARLQPAQIVRALVDVVPNAWQAWAWVAEVLDRLLRQGRSEAALAGSTASLVECLRAELEAQRDELAQEAFDRLVAEGRIAFSLKADGTDYELPREAELQLAEAARMLVRPDGQPVDKSLLEPALRLPGDNQLELEFACYLDAKQTLQWWHRNVARSQYGLQGWKRHKVYPDFVFAHISGADPAARMVVLETKGLQLEGSMDTAYKQALFERLTQAYRDERFMNVGTLALPFERQELVCDLVLDRAWQGAMEAKYFAP